MSRMVPLTKGLFAIVDDDDYERVTAFKWHVIARGKQHHAMRSVKSDGLRWTVYMHRWLMDVAPGREVDHCNRNGLDNRRENLRVCSHAENAVNHVRSSATKTSRYHGVCWNKSRSRWRVVICAARQADKAIAKQVYVGTFRDEQEAARAYDRAAIGLHGEFAITNYPREEYV